MQSKNMNWDIHDRPVPFPQQERGAKDIEHRIQQLEVDIEDAGRRIAKISEDWQGQIMGGMAFSYDMPEGMRHDQAELAKRKKRMEGELQTLREELKYTTEADAIREQYSENLTPLADQVSKPGTVYKESRMDEFLKNDLRGGASYGEARFEMRDVIGHSVVILQPNYRGTMLRRTYGPIDVNGYVLLMPQVMDQRNPDTDGDSDADYGIKEFGHFLSREQMNTVANAIAETAKRIADPKQMGGVRLGPKAVFDILSKVADEVATQLENENEQ